jgi:TATA-box binding protein (TBP) (component of TFIID and TFIIIB)
MNKNNILKSFDIENKPSEIYISTITITCSFDTSFNLIEIANDIVLKEKEIEGKKYGNKIRSSLRKKKKKRENNKTKRDFFNQMTLEVYTDVDKKIINLKIFKNGSIQMTGCKSIEGALNALSKIFKFMKNINCVNDYFKYASNPSSLSFSKINKFKINMINSNFSLGFNINRSVLHVLLSKNNIICSYDPLAHSGIIIKYLDKNTGKIISILVFSSGKIVITGSRSCKQIKMAYDFINTFILKNYSAVVEYDFTSLIDAYLEKIELEKN